MKTTTRIRSAAVATFAAALAAGTLLAAPTTAQAKAPAAQPKANPAVVTHVNALTPAAKRLMKGTGAAAEAKALSLYWTPSRMKSAKSLDKAVFTRAGSSATDKISGQARPQGRAGVVAPSKTARAPRAVKSPSTIAPQTFYPNLPYYYPAARTNGKVFFTRGGLNYVCSASIVNSEGKSLVWTAGHCIVDGQVWDSNFTFVPSYSNGSRPYGTWTAQRLTTTGGWYYNRDFSQDVGAVTMYRNFGWRIADYLGAQGLTWNQTPNYYTCAFGYPQGAPYNGAYLVEACGNTANAGNGTIYMYSGMTGGSSGGPWFRNFDGNWGWVNGHNDFIYTSAPAYMYSPYYGNQVASLYNAVRYQTT